MGLSALANLIPGRKSILLIFKFAAAPQQVVQRAKQSVREFVLLRSKCNLRAVFEVHGLLPHHIQVN